MKKLILLVTILAMGSVCAWAQDVAPSQSAAQFGMVGIVRGQTARVSVVDLFPAGTTCPPGPSRAELTFVDRDGNSFLNQVGRPIRKEVTLEPGQSAWLQISADRILPRDEMRVELRPVIRFLHPPTGGRRYPLDSWLPTFEVIDNATGRTVLLNPGAILGQYSKTPTRVTPHCVSAPDLYLPQDEHYAYAGSSGKPGSGLLLVFLHGKDGAPEHFTNFMSHANDLGYHVIGLSHFNVDSIRAFCKDYPPEANCQGQYRQDVFDGSVTPPSGVPNVYPDGSIRTRLTRFLEYLDARQGSANWSQFLTSGPIGVNSVKWSSVVVAGRSQGNGDVAYIAKHYSVRRVIMFSGTVDCDDSEPVYWLTQPPYNTPPSS